mmetsp:Transcript_27535/g.48663  ORF Transcript_27535/g.48663 Transcript_27535/m.48663 type:complete len:537 (-) Transcript_27535:23-1633(-)
MKSKRVNRLLSRRSKIKSKARSLNVLCGAYFCLLASIYVVFLAVLVLPMIFEGGRVATTNAILMNTAAVGAQKESIAESEKLCSEVDKRIHIIFSTGCNLFQHWQSEVLLNSAMRAGQCGRITRIVSGCEEREDQNSKTDRRFITHQGGKTDQLVSTEDLSKSTNPNFEVHITPLVPEAKEFPWWNKPYSISHFSKHGNMRDDDIIVILDPDQFFIHALTQTGSTYDHILASGAVEREQKGESNLDVVKEGKPVAQFYGIGDRWLKIFDRKQICGQDSNCAKVESLEAWDRYSVGPPYILHAKDFKNVAPMWIDIMKPVYEADRGDMQADMYAYVMAAAHYELPHTRLNHFMVSDVGAELEAWPWVEEVSHMSCTDPSSTFPSSDFPPFVSTGSSPKVPSLLHAAQHYKATHPKTKELWNFHKGHIPGQILDCDQPLVVPPPDDLFNLQTDNRDKRAAYMVCWMTFVVNRAVVDYRKKYCSTALPQNKIRKHETSIDQSDNYNSDKCIRLVVTRDQAPKCGSDGNPDCYPLAKRVC